MFNWPAIIIGFILVIVLGIMGGMKEMYGFPMGVLTAGIIVGYIVNGDLLNGTAHGIIIGVLGAVILTILSIFIGNVSALIVMYVGLVTIDSLVLSIFLGATGGAIGSTIHEVI